MFPDYLVFNAPAAVVSCLFDGHPDPWTSRISTSIFYTEVKRCGGISVSMPSRRNAPVHVEVKAKGCREMEALGIVTDWQEFFVSMIERDAIFSRLDCAVDDETGLLSIDEIITACQEARAISRYKTIDFWPKLNGRTGAIIGRGATFGYRKSLTYIRIYDKALEQRLTGHWIRVEVEAKKRQAQALAKAIAQNGPNVIPAFLLHCLRFVEPNQMCRRDRQVTAAWWTKFLGTETSFRLETAPRNVSRDTNYDWLIRSAGPSFAKHYDNGMGQRLTDEMLASGRLKLAQQVEKQIHTKQSREPVGNLTTARAVQPKNCNIPESLQLSTNQSLVRAQEVTDNGNAIS